jgi:hypothetical protein
MLNEITVLNFYLEEMENGNIIFLKDRQAYNENIKKGIIALRDSEGMNDKVKEAKELWKGLFEASMSFIDPDKRGYDKLFKYFDEYVDFEELIFASDSFYRDHTLHCLWVYFLGEYIIRNKEFELISSKMNFAIKFNTMIKNSIAALDMGEVFDGTVALYEKIINCNIYNESIRCVAAITHDLGYPLKKIEKINRSIKQVLPYFSINNYDEFNFNYSAAHQNFISSFIEFLSTNIGYFNKYDDNDIVGEALRIEKNNIVGINRENVLKFSKEKLIRLKNALTMIPKLQRNMAQYWSYSKDFEEYKHGIMSAYLLVKNVKAFNNIQLSYFDNINIDDVVLPFEDITAKQIILKAVADHTGDGYQISNVSDTSTFLTFIDELEEFSRISRANQNREFVTEFCRTDIGMKEGWLEIDFTFDNTEIDNLDPERAFKGRCERFLSLFNIPKLNEELKIRLRCIGMLPHNQNMYTLEIARKYAKIDINGEEKNIPQYLKSKQLYSREEYEKL